MLDSDTRPQDLPELDDGGTSRREPRAEVPVTMPGSLDGLWDHLHDTHTSARRAPHLGEALVQRGLITPETLARALRAQAHARPHRLLGQLLVDAGALPPQRSISRWRVGSACRSSTCGGWRRRSRRWHASPRPRPSVKACCR
jgi:hypothetical protein